MSQQNPPSVDNVLHQVMSLAAEQVNVSLEQLTPQTRFIEDLNYDSLDMVEFSMQIEEEFNISIPEDMIDKISTIQQATDQISQRLEHSHHTIDHKP